MKCCHCFLIFFGKSKGGVFVDHVRRRSIVIWLLGLLNARFSWCSSLLIEFLRVLYNRFVQKFWGGIKIYYIIFITFNTFQIILFYYIFFKKIVPKKRDRRWAYDMLTMFHGRHCPIPKDGMRRLLGCKLIWILRKLN